MEIIFFTHPSFLSHQSMPRFTRMLADGMRARGHVVKVWSPEAQFYKLPVPKALRKWMGYIDQFIMFPAVVRRRLNSCPKNALFVFTDQALGPWVPLVAHRPHAIHCHDFLALRSALGEEPENPTSWTGSKYQNYIRKGYSQGKNFISVSQHTSSNLHRYLLSIPTLSEVVYNGLNQSFAPQDQEKARKQMENRTGIKLGAGYLLHVGGNQWYKNRVGVIEIYNTWRARSKQRLPLLLIGEAPSATIWETYAGSLFAHDIHFLSNLDDELVCTAYAGASVFLFPSLAEGFGWPIAEAMVSGCPVVTTAEAPMTEVTGSAGFLIPRRPHNKQEVAGWALEAANVVSKVMTLSTGERKAAVEAGVKNAKRFNTAAALDQIEKIYRHILEDKQFHALDAKGGYSAF